MKTIFAFCFLLCFVISSGAQDTTNMPIDNKYFLLGTLGDYMGRQKSKKTGFQIDKYNQSEKVLTLGLHSIISIAYPGLKLDVSVHKVTSRFEYVLHSKVLSDWIDKFYTYEPSGRLEINKEMDQTKEMTD